MTALAKAILMISSREWPGRSCPRIHRRAGGYKCHAQQERSEDQPARGTDRVVGEIEECDSDEPQSQCRPEQRRKRCSRALGATDRQQLFQAHSGQTGQREGYRYRRVLRVEGGPDAEKHIRRMIGENHQETDPQGPPPTPWPTSASESAGWRR